MSQEDVDLNSDHKLSNVPTDSISSLKFYPDPNQHAILAGSWDSKASIWQINCQVFPQQGNGFNTPNNSQSRANITSNPVHQSDFQSPVLSVCWQRGQQKYFAGTCDGSVFMRDVNSQNSQLIGKHNGGCKEVVWDPNLQVLFTGGWDCKLYLWDIRNSKKKRLRMNSYLSIWKRNSALFSR